MTTSNPTPTPTRKEIGPGCLAAAWIWLGRFLPPRDTTVERAFASLRRAGQAESERRIRQIKDK